MRILFSSKLKTGYLDFYESEGLFYALTGFARSAKGVHLEFPAPEVADLTEALLRGLDEDTRLSVVESVLGGKYDKHSSNSLHDGNQQS